MKKRGARKTQDPCEGCGLHRDLCLCDLIPSLDLKTKVVLIVHAKELKRTTNTGQLALKALTNSEIKIRGEKEKHLDLSGLLTPNYSTFLFYPADDAVELTPELVRSQKKPVQLLVPDGNWRQASKVHTRHKELEGVLRVKTKAAATQGPLLRAESKPEGMATLEAIAEALGVIEGDAVRRTLMDLYHLKRQRTLKGRGVKS